MNFKEYSDISDSWRKLTKKKQRSKLVKVFRYPLVYILFKIFVNEARNVMVKAQMKRTESDQYDTKINQHGQKTYEYKKEK